MLSAGDSACLARTENCHNVIKKKKERPEYTRICKYFSAARKGNICLNTGNTVVFKTTNSYLWILMLQEIASGHTDLLLIGFDPRQPVFNLRFHSFTSILCLLYTWSCLCHVRISLVSLFYRLSSFLSSLGIQEKLSHAILDHLSLSIPGCRSKNWGLSQFNQCLITG